MRQYARYVGAILLLLVIPASYSFGQPGDQGVPDSAYLLAPEVVSVDCSPTIRFVVPVYLFTDYGYTMSNLQFSWMGDCVLDTVTFHGQWDLSQDETGLNIDTSASLCELVVFSASGGVSPGAAVVARLVFTTSVGSTLGISVPFEEFTMFQAGTLNGWSVTYQDLDTVFSTPDTLLMSAGDVNCSGIVNVSDAIYLIAYIFGTGSPPYDLNSADVNQECIVNISDAVYLIRYIFGQGTAPLNGCVIAEG